ncbi:MAG: hypothetical protein AAF496_04920 [Pseudomonadota bacterium]
MQIVIHAGVAFTDEGQLLQALMANTALLAQDRVQPLAPHDGRQFVKAASDALTNKTPITLARNNLLTSLPAHDETKRIILSSDKFLGPRRTAILHGQMYPFAAARANFVDLLLDGAEVHLCVGLVNLGFFIPKLLMSLPEDRKQAILGSTDLSCLSWLSMIEDLRDLAPGVKLTVWANEDTPLIWGDILRAMAGLPDDRTLPDEHMFLSNLLTGPGQRRLSELARQGELNDPETARNHIAAVFEETADPAQFEEELELPGWSLDIFDAFSDLYSQDLQKIQTMPDVRFIKP